MVSNWKRRTKRTCKVDFLSIFNWHIWFFITFSNFLFCSMARCICIYFKCMWHIRSITRHHEIEMAVLTLWPDDMTMLLCEPFVMKWNSDNTSPTEIQNPEEKNSQSWQCMVGVISDMGNYRQTTVNIRQWWCSNSLFQIFLLRKNYRTSMLACQLQMQ